MDLNSNLPRREEMIDSYAKSFSITQYWGIYIEGKCKVICNLPFGQIPVLSDFKGLKLLDVWANEYELNTNYSICKIEITKTL